NDPQAGSGVERRASGHGGNPPGQGPFVTLHLLIREEIIQEAAYETYQCPGCHACGRAICEMLKGSTLARAAAIEHAALADRVGPLPSHRRHCYGLALLALVNALGQLKIREGRG